MSVPDIVTTFHKCAPRHGKHIARCLTLALGMLTLRRSMVSAWLHVGCTSLCIQQKIGIAEVSVGNWNVGIYEALRICEERHVTVEGWEGSYVSCDRVDDPWPCELCALKCLLEDDFIFPSFLVQFQPVCMSPLSSRLGSS